MQATPNVHHARAVPLAAWVSTAVAIGSIWFSIIVAGLVAPDFVSGSEHQHLALVGAIDWVWGLVATAFVILAVLQGIRLGVTNRTPWAALAIGVAAVWVLVLAVTGCGPVMVTGTDPTTIPLAAMGVPILGVFLTWFVCVLVKSAFEQES
jgi:hypothetical protein